MYTAAVLIISDKGYRGECVEISGSAARGLDMFCSAGCTDCAK